jgi:ribonuclease J
MDATVAATSGGRRRNRDDSEIKSAVKGAVSNFLYKATRRNPMVIPVITRV